MPAINSQIAYELSKDGKTLTLTLKLIPGRVTEKGNTVLATTGGNQALSNGAKIGLTVYKPKG